MSTKTATTIATAARSVQEVSAESIGSMVVCEFRHATVAPEALNAALIAHGIGDDYVVAVRTVESAFVRGCATIMDGNYMPPTDGKGKVKGAERKALKRAFRSLPVVEEGSVMTMSVAFGSKASATEAEVAHFGRIAYDRATNQFSSTLIGGAGTDEHDAREFLARAKRAEAHMADAAGNVDGVTARRGLWYYMSAKLGSVQLTQGSCFLPNVVRKDGTNPVAIIERLKAAHTDASNGRWGVYTVPLYRGTDGHRLAADSATAEIVTRIDALHERVREFVEAGKARPDSIAAVARDWQALDTDASLLESLLGVAVDHVRTARAEAERTLQEIAGKSADAKASKRKASTAERRAELAAKIAADAAAAGAPPAPVESASMPVEPEPEAEPVKVDDTDVVDAPADDSDTSDDGPQVVPVDDSGSPIEGAAPLKRAKAAAPKAQPAKATTAKAAAKPAAKPAAKQAPKAKAKAKPAPKAKAKPAAKSAAKSK